MEIPLISFIVVARNEEEYLHDCLSSIVNQTIDKDKYEIILVDGMSSDRTQQIMNFFIEECPNLSIRCFVNPKLILSSGWNIGIKEGRGKYAVRIDAHAKVPCDFLEKNLMIMTSHPDVFGVGGIIKTVGKGFWGEVIAEALSCRMGVGGSRFRVGGKPGPTDTIVYALYNREKLLELGGFDERIPLNQDNVLHGRIRERGGILYFDPNIKSTYYCRSSIKELWKQMLKRSYWLMLIIRHQPRYSFCFRHLVPFLFVVTVFAFIILSVFWKSGLFLLLGFFLLYFLVGWGYSFGMRISFLQKLMIPLVFLSLHISYGLGTLFGIIAFVFYTLPTD